MPDLSHILDWNAWVHDVQSFAGSLGLSIGPNPTPADLTALINTLQTSADALAQIGASTQAAALYNAISQLRGARDALNARNAGGGLINIGLPNITFDPSINPSLNIDVPKDAILAGAAILGVALLAKT